MKKITLTLVLLCGAVASGVPAAQSVPGQTAATEVAPGIALPSAGTVWALDVVSGKTVPVQVEQHPVHINKHQGENFALGITKGKATVDISEPHAGIKLQSGAAVLLARTYAADTSGHDTSSYSPDEFYQLIRLETHNKVRVVHTLEYGRAKGKVYRYDQVVETTATRISGTPWLKIVPAKPLPAGEYAIEAKMPDPYTYSTAIWDFGVSGATVQTAAN